MSQPRLSARSRSLSLVAAVALATTSLGCQNDLIDEELTETDAVVNPSGDEQALTMPSCGTSLAWFDGTDARSNAGNTGTGNSCAGVGGIAGGLQYQCVELVMRHFKRKWDLRWYGNAKDLLDNAPRASVDVINNGDVAHPPQPGDMIVWKTGQWGHVALVTAVGADFVDIIEQNVNGSGSARLPFRDGTVGARWNSWVPAGWAHAKANHATNPTPTPPAPTPNPTTPNPTPTPPADGGCAIAGSGGVVEEDAGCVDLGGNPQWLRAVAGEGSAGELVWTTPTADQNVDNSATWRVNLARAGTYRVEAFIDSDVASSQQARYRVRHDGVVDETVIDQRTRGWRSLGEFRFAAGGSQRVYLGDNTGEAVAQRKKLVFDAVRVTPVCAQLQVTTGGAQLNVRAQPNASAARLGAFDAGTLVNRVGTVDGARIESTTIWHEVSANGLRGYVTGAYVACP